MVALGNIAMRWPVTSYVSLAHDIAGHFDPALARRAEPDRTIDPTLKPRLHAAFWQWLRGEPGDEGFSPAWLESWPAADRPSSRQRLRSSRWFLRGSIVPQMRK